jgi:hypothetical protein
MAHLDEVQEERAFYKDLNAAAKVAVASEGLTGLGPNPQTPGTFGFTTRLIMHNKFICLARRGNQAPSISSFPGSAEFSGCALKDFLNKSTT